MSDTTFVNNSTIIDATWLNDVNDTVYHGLAGAQTPADVRTALGLGTAAQFDVGTTANKVVQLDGTAKLPAVDGSQLTGITATVIDVTGATGTLPVAHGGTGGTTAATARANLGSTTVGDAVFIAADAAAGRTALSAAGSGSVTSSGLTQATSKILGRTTAGTGAPEEIGVSEGVQLVSGALKADVNGLTEDTTPDTANDFALVWDASASAHKKVKLNKFSGGGITLGTAVSLTTQTSIDYTGLPSGIKRLTISFQGVSTNGTDRWLVQIGNATFTTTGYAGQVISGAGVAANSSGFEINNNVVAANNHSGQIVITKVDTNTYAQSGVVASQTTSNSLATSGGSIALGAELERIRITTTGGTNQFDAGKINIAYE